MCKKNLNIKVCFKFFFMYILFFYCDYKYKFFLVNYIFYLKDLGIYLMWFFLIKEKKFLKFKFG